MKRFFACALLLVITFAMTGCGAKEIISLSPIDGELVVEDIDDGELIVEDIDDGELIVEVIGDEELAEETAADDVSVIETHVDKTMDTGKPRHAPNMYVEWTENNIYDAISVDWYCEIDAEGTYWAVHNWDTGYAGFQNLDGKHVILLSLWDLPGGIKPTIEYALNGQKGEFGHDGTGKQVFTEYEWECGKWYTMCIKMEIQSNKTRDIPYFINIIP